ncbi:MAG: cysteine desulfurase family protein [Spirochaetota bacterium]
MKSNNNKSDQPVYLDYNATTPHDPEVVAEMLPYLEKHFGNPSSSHQYGILTKQAVEDARSRVASLLECKPSEIVFTSGGTESNNNAIKGAAFTNRHRGSHIITTCIEHPAVFEVCRFLEKQGFRVTCLPVDRYGLVSISDVKKAIGPQTILITIMHANNEVGTIQPVEEISKIAHEQGIIVHTDAAQSVGKIPVDVKSLGVDLLSIAGHKLYAPKGVGAMYIRNGVKLEKILHGAGQENGKRPGTENVLEIVGLGKACQVAERDLLKNMEHMKKMTDRLYTLLSQKTDNIRLNGHPQKRLPNTLSLSFKGIEAQSLLTTLKDKVAVSAGAACHADRVEISRVLKAVGLPVEWARGTIRFSTGRMTTKEELERAAGLISEALQKKYDHLF